MRDGGAGEHALQVVAGAGAGVEDRERAALRQGVGYGIRNRFIEAEREKAGPRFQQRAGVTEDAPGCIEDAEVAAAVAVEAMPVRAAENQAVEDCERLAAVRTPQPAR